MRIYCLLRLPLSQTHLSATCTGTNFAKVSTVLRPQQPDELPTQNQNPLKDLPNITQQRTDNTEPQTIMASSNSSNPKYTSLLSVLLLVAALLVAASPAAAARSSLGLTAAAGVSARLLLQDASQSNPSSSSSSSQSNLQQQCMDAYNAYGGTSGIASRVPSCSQQNFKFQQCCMEVSVQL